MFEFDEAIDRGDEFKFGHVLTFYLEVAPIVPAGPRPWGGRLVSETP
jgi:hypothetical protein